MRKIIVLDSQSIAVCTSFGVFTYSSALKNKYIFNPYELDPTMTPAKVCQMILSEEYSAAISGALSLNMPIRKLLRKIPMQNIRQTISELDSTKLTLLL